MIMINGQISLLMMIIWTLLTIRLHLDDDESESRMGQPNELNGMQFDKIAIVMLIMAMILTVMKIGMVMLLMMLSLE